MTKQTFEQKQASDPHASVWVGASAGTGKTFVLTNRVLRILLTGIRPERILCLTFTKAAAAEMANRINSRLGEWVAATDEKLCAEILDLTGEFPTGDQQNLARKLFARVLDVPSGLKIQTIHSFCQSLLGRFPLEAGIAPHFQVMDERTTLEHLSKARDAVLTEADSQLGTTLCGALDHISRRVTENAFADLIRELIGQRSGLERMMRHFGQVDNAIAAMVRLLDLDPLDSIDTVIACACADGSFNHMGLHAAMNALFSGSAANKKSAQVMADWLSTPDKRVQNFEDYKRVFLTQTEGLRKTLMPKKIAEGCPNGILALEAEAARILDVADKIKRLVLLDNSRALLLIGAAMLDAFRHSKARHAVMDYDDLILKVTGLIDNATIADWILYKLDGGIDHILIDEAQDTNPEQWQVVKALANEFFVGESQSEQLRTIFAVGDVKQSIYSFQRADPKEFVENRRVFQQKSHGVDHVFHNVNLALSFRSTSVVLTLVDQVFFNTTSRLALSFSDAEIIHRPSRIGHGGIVELWPTIKADQHTEPDDWQPPVIQEPLNAPEMKLALKIADRISDWLEGGEILTSKARPIGAGDIIILVRKRSKFDDYMIRALKARNIPVAGQDKMVLSEQIAVMDLVAAGNFVLLPSDDLTLAVVLKSPFIGFSEEDLYDLAYGRKESLWATLLARKSAKPIFQKAHDFLISLSNFADTAPPFEFYNHLLATLQGRKKLIIRLGEEANDPIDEFLQLASGFEVNNISSLQGFLSWVDRGNLAIKRDMEQSRSQVRIMTIHGAKGLQAPIVILPDTCQVPKKGSQLLWANADDIVDKDATGVPQEPLLFWPSKKIFEVGVCKGARERINITRDQEYLRLLYVALTRAEDRLYITGWEGKAARSEKCWYDVIHKAIEIMAPENTTPENTTPENTTPENIKIIKQGDGDQEDYLWRLTCPQTADISKKDHLSTPPSTGMPFPPWAVRPAPFEPSPLRPLSPSRPTEDEPAVLSPLKSRANKAQETMRFNRGRLIHRLLEILPNMQASSRPDAARRFLEQPAYALGPNDIDQIIEQVVSILTDPLFAEVFSDHSRAEVSIVGLVGTTAISGQVDRLVVTKDQVLIVDYKTNRPPPMMAQDVSRLYIRQMAAYRAVLSDIYPNKMIKCLLLWTDVAHLMELPDNLLEQINF